MHLPVPPVDQELAGQLVQTVKPVEVMYEPAEQAVHAEVPVVLAYVPAAQAVQAVTVLSLYVPAWQGRMMAGVYVSPLKL